MRATVSAQYYFRTHFKFREILAYSGTHKHSQSLWPGCETKRDPNHVLWFLKLYNLYFIHEERISTLNGQQLVYNITYTQEFL
jgi:hypothetical protein